MVNASRSGQGMKLMDESTAGKGGPVGQRVGPNHFRAGPIQCWLWPLQQQKTAADFHLGRKTADPARLSIILVKIKFSQIFQFLAFLN